MPNTTVPTIWEQSNQDLCGLTWMLKENITQAHTYKAYDKVVQTLMLQY